MSASQYSRFTSVRRPAVRRRRGCASAVLISALLWPAHSALAQFTQYGNKLVGTGAVGAAHKACRSRCPPTATPPSWAVPAITRIAERRGCLPAAAASGPRRATSWSAWTWLGLRWKAFPLRCPPMATPPSWAGVPTTATPERHGCLPGSAASGPSRARSWSAPAPSGALSKAIGRAVRRRQHRHRGRLSRQ